VKRLKNDILHDTEKQIFWGNWVFIIES